MLILAVETSTAVSSVALGSEQGILASAMVSRGKGHAEFLVPAIKFLCDQAGIGLPSLGGIAVGVGPGLYTGMRVGMATAKTLAQALRVPIVGIPSLDLLAFEVRYSPKLICACLDARRSEVFSAFYRQVPGGVQRVSKYFVELPERLAVEVSSRVEDVLFVGSGALLYRDRLPQHRTEWAALSRAFPNASALLELAAPRFFREETDPLLDLEPLYLRKSDAQIAWEQRGITIARPDRVKTRKREEER